MELVIKPYDALPCRLSTFIINGIDADQDDFGSVYDHDYENAEPYACADMYFESNEVSNEILDKYNITEEEYNDICQELTNKLCIGCCGWCV